VPLFVGSTFYFLSNRNSEINNSLKPKFIQVTYINLVHSSKKTQHYPFAQISCFPCNRVNWESKSPTAFHRTLFSLTYEVVTNRLFHLLWSSLCTQNLFKILFNISLQTSHRFVKWARFSTTVLNLFALCSWVPHVSYLIFLQFCALLIFDEEWKLLIFEVITVVKMLMMVSGL
jgi:hypothetical protein